jgi:hypothetical protein
MKLYDNKKEEKLVQDALLRQDEDFLESTEDILGDFDFSTLFDDEDDITEATLTDQPYAQALSVYQSDKDFYTDLFSYLRMEGDSGREIHQIEPGYVEIKASKDLHRVLYDLPPEARPVSDGFYRLSMDTDLVQKSIEDARKRSGEWAAFQILYDLHPVVRYYMTKLEASVNKDEALVAKTRQVPADTVWYVFMAQVSNNLGQPVLVDFIVSGMHADGRAFSTPIALADFIDQYGIHEQLYTEEITEAHLANIRSILDDAVDWTDLYMGEQQQRLQMRMEQKLQEYSSKLQDWHREAREQLEIDFSDAVINHFTKRRKNDREREIETILSKSGQYYKDLTSLDGNPYLKVLAVFYN